MASERGRTYGVIHIGSVALSFCIAVYRSLDQVEIIQEARRAAPFGEEVFTTGELSFTSIRQMCRILNGFRRILADYQVTEVTVIATAVLREAKNRASILDLVKVHTGLEVRVLDMPEEIFSKHFAIHHRLNRMVHTDWNTSATATLFVDITSSVVGFTVWERGNLRYQQNVHLGTLRLLESFRRNERESQDFPAVLQEYLRGMLKPLWPVLESYTIRYVVLSGRDSRLVGHLLKIHGKQPMVMVRPEAFAKVFREAGHRTAPELRQRYGLADGEAEMLLPSLHLYAAILDRIRAEYLVMVSMTFLHGATLFYGANLTDDPELFMLREQHLEMAKTIAERYGGDVRHLATVADFGGILMRALQPIHGLDSRAVYLLRMAALLHQVGRFVNVRRNNEHTYHIIKGTDIFGLSDAEKEIVAVVAYYNYKGRPSDEDEPFARLTETAKMTVRKLVAVLRLACAMDKGEAGKLHKVQARLRRDRLHIDYEAAVNTSLEEWTFAAETKLFSDVFGMDAALERRMK